MKRIGILAAFAALTGCGWYTNVPAQLKVLSIEPATVQVTFEGPKVSFTNPTVTVQGQNGSIGTTFGGAKITYGGSVNDKTTAISLRVEPTYLKKYPSETSETKDVEFVPGTGNAILPIIDQDVIEALKSKRSMIATVNMDGLDDANFPSHLTFYVPIVSVGNPSAQ